jgi:hypothetical protein
MTKKFTIAMAIASLSCWYLMATSRTNASIPLDAIAVANKTPSALPKAATLKQLTAGDLMCYVDVVDNRGKTRHLPASFEICEQNKYLNKKVRLYYKKLKFNDCQSAEPCGKTKVQTAIYKMQLAK